MTAKPALAAVAACCLALGAWSAPAPAQEEELRPLRIGVVVPSRTGEVPIPTSVNDFIGEAALIGARLSEARLADLAAEHGFRLDVLLANAPVPAAARRAGERLVEVEQVSALIGGVGEGQAPVLLDIAEAAGIPFLNIGDTDPALRGEACSPYAFHIEASTSMYLDAMAALSATEGWSRWFVIHEDTPEGKARRARAEVALSKFVPDGEIAGSAAVLPQQPSYYEELDDAADSGADVAVLLLDPFDQLVFIGQQEAIAPELASLGFPHTLSQTRDYIAAARHVAPNANPAHRVALWETTLEAEGAGAFNETLRSRWGEPADPTAWAAFHAIKIVIEAAGAAAETDGEAIAETLRRPGLEFDVLKGPGVSFRPWNHQLRQPLYDITVDRELDWERMELETRIGIAGDPERLPPPAEGSDPVTVLDRLGDGPEDSACRL